MPLLEITNLSFTYAGAEKPALQDVSLCLEPGDFALLTGRTGCGKSTLLRQIKRELTPRGDRTGQVLFQGQALEDLSPRESAARIGFVFQRPEEQIVELRPENDEFEIQIVDLKEKPFAIQGIAVKVLKDIP